MRALDLLFLMLFYNSSFAVERISEATIDLEKPHLIQMSYGRPTLIEFPCTISHSIQSLTGDLKVLIGPDNRETLTLWLTSPGSQPTTVTVKCDEEFYVLDVLPSLRNHQDVLKIADAKPFSANSRRKLKDSSKVSVNAPKSRGRLIMSSKMGEPKGKDILERLNSNRRPRRLVKRGEG